jgi:prepilin-type N-terminal cleavage/methylation domain-containing protein
MKWHRTQSASHGKGGGFTLTEMLVSVAILSVMIIAFSQILSQVRKVVAHAQLTIRTNTAASAIAEVIRRDFREVAKSGFLYIRNDCIMATTAGVQHSLVATVPTTAMGSAVHYGLSGDVLFRQGWLLTGEGVADPNDDIWDEDGENLDLADLTAMTADIALGTCSTKADDVVALVVPPTTLAEVNQMWRVLTTNVSNLTIYYGTVAGTAVTWTEAPTEPSVGTGFWTHHDRDNWPDLVRIKFTLEDGAFEKRALPGGLLGVYEVVCRIGH